FIEAEKTRPYFRQMKVIFDIVQKHRPTIKWLSMGMSNDYIQAIEEGANMVRIGTAIFWERNRD
ncbi:MAG: YggS family pyridoxal phosphate-dependent enzyme, partial [Candidatus Woesearchaeota archaeon]